jgi:CBS domain-containing protein
MTSPVVTVTRTASITECALLLHARKMRHLPVVDEAGQLEGIVTDFEIRPRGRVVDGAFVPRDPDAGSLVAAQLTREVEVTRGPDDLLWDALDALADSEQDVLLAVEGGRPVGILTEHDVVRLASQRPDLRAPPPSPRGLPLIEAATPPLEARSWMARKRAKHALVVRDGVLVGVLSLRDLAVEDYVEHFASAGEAASEPITLRLDVDGDWNPAQVAKLLYERKIGCLPVVDATGRPVRLLTRRDLVVALAAERPAA